MTPSTWKMWRVSDLGRNDGGDEYDGDDEQIGKTFPKLFHKIAQGCQKMFRFWSLCFSVVKFLLWAKPGKGVMKEFGFWEFPQFFCGVHVEKASLALLTNVCAFSTLSFPISGPRSVSHFAGSLSPKMVSGQNFLCL